MPSGAIRSLYHICVTSSGCASRWVFPFLSVYPCQWWMWARTHRRGFCSTLPGLPLPLVPILLAASPFLATRSQPTKIISIFPDCINMDAMLSHCRVVVIPALYSSKDVRRAPWAATLSHHSKHAWPFPATPSQGQCTWAPWQCRTLQWPACLHCSGS